MFEVTKSDLAGRIGVLHTKHGKVETPAFVPVIHPVRQTIPPKLMKEMGIDLVITNSYITLRQYGKEAIQRGIHDIIGFDGSVMTDSGGYQVLEYGDVDVEPLEIARYQNQIGADISIPLDKPTGFGLPKKMARSYVDHTLKISKKTLDEIKDDSQIWAGPVQGGEHFDLVKQSTKGLMEIGFQMLALGSPVEFMGSYEFGLLSKMILTVKKQIPSSIPLHLFGAGHPLTIPLAVALGCDTFDSASYMLYAKKERYISEDRTFHLRKIYEFSCPCDVCSKFSPKELLGLDEKEMINKLALHNLHAINSEVSRVKQAIFEGRLWEYVIKKARSHPKLFEANEIFTRNSDHFEKTTPQFKDSAIFLFEPQDQFRPEVSSYHKVVQKFKTKKRILVVSEESTLKPFYLSKEYSELKQRFDEKSIQFFTYNPFLGPIPLEISDLYPAAHYVMSRTKFNPEDFPLFEKTWMTLFEKNNFKEIYWNKKDEFLNSFVKKLPNTIKKKSI